MPPTTDNRQPTTAQSGFTLAAVIALLTIIMVVIAYTVPQQWSLVMKRERDRQTIFLMKQYARAILAWETKNRGLPVSLEQLQEARDPRMIRGGGKWPCPITGKEDDWILVPPGAIQQDGQLVNTTTQDIMGNSDRDKKKNENANKVGIGNPDGSTPSNAPATGGGSGKLNPEASPADYVGPFVAVRPNATGKSYIELNGASDYGEWVYSLQDLKNELASKQQALQQP